MKRLTDEKFGWLMGASMFALMVSLVLGGLWLSRGDPALVAEEPVEVESVRGASVPERADPGPDVMANVVQTAAEMRDRLNQDAAASFALDRAVPDRAITVQEAADLEAWYWAGKDYKPGSVEAAIEAGMLRGTVIDLIEEARLAAGFPAGAAAVAVHVLHAGDGDPHSRRMAAADGRVGRGDAVQREDGASGQRGSLGILVGDRALQPGPRGFGVRHLRFILGGARHAAGYAVGRDLRARGLAG